MLTCTSTVCLSAASVAPQTELASRYPGLPHLVRPGGRRRLQLLFELPHAALHSRLHVTLRGQLRVQPLVLLLPRLQDRARRSMATTALR